MLAVFVQVTVVPTFTVSVAGEKAKLTIETAEPPPCWLPVVAVAAGAVVLVAAAGAVVGVGVVALVVPPQPTSAVASASAQRPPIVAARQERGRLFIS